MANMQIGKGDIMALGQDNGQRIILTSPISRTPQVGGYGPREAFLEISLLLAQVRRRLLKSNDEHGNKVMRKEILDGFGEVDRFAVGRLEKAGIIYDAGDIDIGKSRQQTSS
jgi:hypothetical protein